MTKARILTVSPQILDDAFAFVQKWLLMYMKPQCVKYELIWSAHLEYIVVVDGLAIADTDLLS